MTTQSTPSEATTEPLGKGEDTTVSVSRVVSHPLDTVWAALMKPEGAEALLGSGGRLGSKGDAWRADDGTQGVTRSFHPLEQIRFSWHEHEGSPATLVDLHLRSIDDQHTELELTHGQLPEDVNIEELRVRWQSALETICSTTP